MGILAIVLLCCQFVPCLPALRKGFKYGGSRAHTIAYGGVLNEVSKVTANHTLITEAAQFAIDWSLSRHADSIPRDQHGEVLSYTVSAPRILRLVYTDDDRSPYMYDPYYPSLRHTLQPLIWGHNFQFRVSWELDGQSWNHIYMITSHQDHLYILQHTFHVAALPVSVATPPVQALPRLAEGAPITALGSATASDLSTSDFCSRDAWLSELWMSPAQSNRHRNRLYNRQSQDRTSHKTPESPAETGLSEASGNGISCRHGDEADVGNGVSSLHDNKGAGASQSCQHDDDDDDDDDDEGDVGNGDSCQLGQPVNVSFLCYNVWNTNTVLKKEGEYRKRMDRMSKLLQSSQAAIIGLQEVRFHHGCCDDLGPNQLDHISAQLPNYQFVYRPGQIQSSELPRRVEEGVAIFSKYPVTKVRHLLLTRNASDIADSHQRVLLHAEIDIPCFGLVNVLTTHLSLSHKARAVSVREIWNYIQKLGEPVFLMGDFNAEIHNEEIRFLHGLHQFDGVTTRGLHDVWYTLHPSQQGFTFNTLEQQLSKRIDFLFMREDSRVSVSQVTLLDDGGRGSEAASDHLGLLSTFTMKAMESQRKQ